MSAALRAHIARYLKEKQPDVTDARRTELLEGMLLHGGLTPSSSVAELWNVCWFVMTGKHVDGTGLADAAKVALVTAQLLEAEAKRWDCTVDELTPEQRLDVAFQVSERARKDGYRPPGLITDADKINALSDEQLAARFPSVGDARDFAKMVPSERLKWAQVFLKEQTDASAATALADAKAAANADDDAGLTPEQRLDRVWA